MELVGGHGHCIRLSGDESKIAQGPQPGNQREDKWRVQPLSKDNAHTGESDCCRRDEGEEGSNTLFPFRHGFRVSRSPVTVEIDRQVFQRWRDKELQRGAFDEAHGPPQFAQVG